MTNPFSNSAVFSSTSKADLLANQVDQHMDEDESNVDTTTNTQVLQIKKQVGLSVSASLIVGTMIGSGILGSVSGVLRPGRLCRLELDKYGQDAA